MTDARFKVNEDDPDDREFARKLEGFMNGPESEMKGMVKLVKEWKAKRRQRDE